MLDEFVDHSATRDGTTVVRITERMIAHPEHGSGPFDGEGGLLLARNLNDFAGGHGLPDGGGEHGGGIDRIIGGDEKVAIVLVLQAKDVFHVGREAGDAICTQTGDKDVDDGRFSSTAVTLNDHGDFPIVEFTDAEEEAAETNKEPTIGVIGAELVTND